MAGRGNKKQSRKNDENKRWLLGVYGRRSFDDGENSESYTIKNQKALIESFIENLPNVEIEDYYIDEKRIMAKDIDPSNPVHKDLMRLSILCNDSTNIDGEEIGDPTETALINLADKLGIPPQRVRKAYPRLSELPFDSDRKMMSTFHLLKDGYTMVTKGAVDVLIKRIKYISFS